MARYLRNDEMVDRLKKAVGGGRKHATWAREHRVDQAVLSLVLAGKREMPESIAMALGYHKGVFYVKATRGE